MRGYETKLTRVYNCLQFIIFFPFPRSLGSRHMQIRFLSCENLSCISA